MKPSSGNGSARGNGRARPKRTCGDFGGRKDDGSPCRRRSRKGLCPGHAGGPTKSTKRRQKAFLDALRVTGIITSASAAAGVNRSCHYEWLEDPKYAQRFRDAQDEALDALETEAHRRAVSGNKRFKFHQGEPINDPETGEPYYELEHSDTLLIFLLKAGRPEKYRERFEHRHAGEVSITFGEALSKLRIEEEEEVPCPSRM